MYYTKNKSHYWNILQFQQNIGPESQKAEKLEIMKKLKWTQLSKEPDPFSVPECHKDRLDRICDILSNSNKCQIKRTSLLEINDPKTQFCTAIWSTNWMIKILASSDFKTSNFTLCLHSCAHHVQPPTFNSFFHFFFSLLPNLVSLEDYSRFVITDVQVTHTHQSKPDLVTSGPFIECQFKAV